MKNTTTIFTKLLTGIALFMLITSLPTRAQVSQEEFEALKALYKATDGPNWKFYWDINATANDVNDYWPGLTIENGHVTEIYLPFNNMTGSIPAEIGNLSQLTMLYLNNNTITHLPPEIGNLSQLTMLSLNNNTITNLPPEIGNLSQLIDLDLFNNLITQLPPEIGNLLKLEKLGLNRNQLSYLPPEIGNLKQLPFLQLNSNQLTQIPPEIGNLSQLTGLDLSDNQLTQIPPEIGNLSQLTGLYLSDNQLTQIPPEIGKLTQLKELSLYGNQLIQLPPEIGNLSKLYRLDLSGNQITQLPSKIGNLTQLSELWLHGNQITQLPPEIGNLSKLHELYLSGNQITQLPPNINNLLKLQKLNLNNNQLTQLPSEIGNLSQLSELYIENNQLTQLPPEIGNLSQLSLLFLDSNQLAQIPSEIVKLTKLSFLYVRYNYLKFNYLEPFSKIPYFKYSPQNQNLYKQTIYVTENNITIIDSKIGGKYTTCQWFKDGYLIEGEKDTALTIKAFDPDRDLGIYTCKATNSLFPKLTLYSDTFRILLKEGTKAINGYVFNDQNLNGVRDNGEPLMKNQLIEVVGRENRMFTGEDGGFEFYFAKDGTYSVECNPKQIWKLTTDSIVSVALNNETTSQSIAFGLAPNQDYTDLSIYFDAPFARAGFTHTYSGNVYNHSVNANLTSKCSLVVDNRFKFVSANPTNYSKSGDTISWELPAIEPEHAFNFSLTLTNPGVELMGDTLFSLAKVEVTNAKDLDGANNVFPVYTQVVASYDPNDKLCSPAGFAKENYVVFGQALQYTVRFQNTGNFPAYQVVIEDSIDQNLDISSFTLMGSSHEVTKVEINGHTIKITLEGIELVAEQDEQYDGQSEGYVTFTLTPKNGIAEYTAVNNTAGIYFDYNPAITTNTVLYTYVSEETLAKLKKRTSIRKNEPETVTLQYLGNQIYKLSSTSTNFATGSKVIVTDISCKVLQTNNLSGSSEKLLNLSYLRAGLYFIVVNTRRQQKAFKVVVDR